MTLPHASVIDKLGVLLSAGFQSTGFQIDVMASLKDTHRKKPLSNKTPATTKCRNMGISTIGTSNQLFIRSS